MNINSDKQYKPEALIMIKKKSYFKTKIWYINRRLLFDRNMAVGKEKGREQQRWFSIRKRMTLWRRRRKIDERHAFA